MEPSLIQRCQALLPQLICWRRDFHQYPELGWCEFRTASRTAAVLEKLGWRLILGPEVTPAHERMGLPSAETLERCWQFALEHGGDPRYLPQMKGGFTGVIGVLDCGPGPAVALRFDLDALPVTEPEAPDHLPYREGFSSRIHGQMHACGHDGHITSGLGTAAILSQLRSQLHGTVLLVFQPAEEGVRGGASVAASGLLDGTDYLLGAHVGPSEAAQPYLITAGDFRSLATTKLDVTFRGRTAHAGFTPELGQNAMLAAATAVLNLHAIPRHGSGDTRINVGRLTAGSGRNLVCDTARLELEVRGSTTQANDFMEQRTREILQAAALMHQCQLEVETVGSAPCVENSLDLAQQLCRIIPVSTGLPCLPPLPGSLGSEDYSYLSQRVLAQGGQSCYFNHLCPMAAPLHSEHFDFDEQDLVHSTAAFSAAVLSLLSKE